MNENFEISAELSTGNDQTHIHKGKKIHPSCYVWRLNAIFYQGNVTTTLVDLTEGIGNRTPAEILILTDDGAVSLMQTNFTRFLREDY